MQEFKKWEDLTITDDFMFCKVMSDPDICKELLEILLHIKIDRLVFQEPQKSFRLTSESKGIRLDVYVKDSNRVFDIELQTTNERNLELRTRYYQGVMDISELEKGEFFSNMKESYIIFICMFDPFGADIPIYTVKQTFAENDKLIFNDKTHKIFYNVKAFEKIANDVETKAFLEYLCKHQSTTKFTQSLETAVYRNKNNQNWRKDYMTLAYNLSLAAEKAAKKAREEGIAIGEERGISIGITQGAREAKLETARKFLAMGLLVEQVADGTGLSPEEIEKL
ncbi:MAG: Rpn family recombination-promoting nuclease/putative transposase [Spirochaetales bacterium]|nr:Rpn family recombination-promoting nuclease/putative transposase [Spirochaetales bacterium]